MPHGKRSVALFGGTFDPIHRGHLFIADEARRQLALDEIIFVPCYQSPHKPGVVTAPAADRFKMIQLALTERPWASVSSLEISKPKPSYSWETATHFSNQLGDECDLHWLLGADQWEVIEKWTKAEDLAELVTFIILPRDGAPEPQSREGFRSSVLRGSFKASGTEIRKRLSAGHIRIDELPEAVADYVEKYGLYGSK